MIELGLSRTHRLLAQTPLPWRAIHVAGTNGKGSICAYVSHMLERYNNSDLRHQTEHKKISHGRFNSPHLIDRWDCITINGTTVAHSLFRDIESRVLKRNEDQKIGASEFEILTATAFEIFTRTEVDIGVIEVGMGGRLDATNILGQQSQYDVANEKFHNGRAQFRSPPLVTAISSIGLDHQAFLGNTLGEIAREKAGILKPGVSAIAAVGDQSTQRAIENEVRRIGSSGLNWISKKTTLMDIWLRSSASGSNELLEADIDQLQSPVQSRWPNGAIALDIVWQVLEQLHRLAGAPIRVLLQTILDLAQVPDQIVWPGRLQTISLKDFNGFEPAVLLDGAHNLQSAEVLASFARTKAARRSTHWMLAASDGKDINQILRVLLRPGDSVSAVEFGPVDGMPWVKPMRSESITAAASKIQPGAYLHYGRSIEDALGHATNMARKEDQFLVIAGSLYLVGDIMRLLRDKPK